MRHRCHGQTPSISTMRDQDNTIRTVTMMPSTATL